MYPRVRIEEQKVLDAIQQGAKRGLAKKHGEVFVRGRENSHDGAVSNFGGTD